MRHRPPLAASLLVVIGALSLFPAACGGGSGGSTTSTDPETIEIPTRWASGNAADLRTLVQNSDQVFLGRVSRVVGQSEPELPGADIKRQLPPMTSFEVTVSSTMAGTLAPGATVVIEQAGGTIATSDGRRAVVVLEGDTLLEDGAEYLFFASRKSNGNLTAPPFGRLQVTADGSLVPLDAWSELGALKQLSGLSAAAAAAAVRAPE